MNPMDYAETYSGRRVHLTQPDPDTIHLPDIAHALANQCRYNGHCRLFYSVAEHSVRVSELLQTQGASPLVCLAGLLHDAGEAYTGDCISPVKRLVSGLHEVEGGIMEAVHYAAGIIITPSDRLSVKQADLQLLADEAFVLMPSRGADWRLGVVPRLPQDWAKTLAWEPVIAESHFLNAFYGLAEAASVLMRPTFGGDA